MAMENPRGIVGDAGRALNSDRGKLSMEHDTTYIRRGTACTETDQLMTIVVVDTAKLKSYGWMDTLVGRISLSGSVTTSSLDLCATSDRILVGKCSPKLLRSSVHSSRASFFFSHPGLGYMGKDVSSYPTRVNLQVTSSGHGPLRLVHSRI